MHLLTSQMNQLRNKRIGWGVPAFWKESGRPCRIRNLSPIANQLPQVRKPRISPHATRFARRSIKPDQTLGFQEIHCFLTVLFERDMHAKRVLSLTNAALCVIRSTSLAVSVIGQGLALARGPVTRHAIKQADRLLSNQGIGIDAPLRRWVPCVAGPRSSIKVAMD
jgi:hypothetical protein